MLQIATRAQRDLPPYVSPKKVWDQFCDVLDAEVLVEAAPSSRRYRRQRARDLAAMGRKSRRAGNRKAFQRRQLEENLRGVARVYLQGKGTPEMRYNVTKMVHRLAEQRAAQTGAPVTGTIKEVEGKLLNALARYGDDL